MVFLGGFFVVVVVVFIFFKAELICRKKERHLQLQDMRKCSPALQAKP